MQEILSNVLQHSRATSVRVNAALEQAPDQAGVVVVKVEDNGLGFNCGAVTRGRGLKQMQERARRLGGRLSFDAATGPGTRVCLRLPVEGIRE